MFGTDHCLSIDTMHLHPPLERDESNILFAANGLTLITIPSPECIYDSVISLSLYRQASLGPEPTFSGSSSLLSVPV
jgi:hypothetical protein